MNSRYLLALLILLFAFNACKDSDNDEPVLTNPSLLIKSATNYQDGKVNSTSNYEYDNSGRIVKVTFNGNRYEKYNYVSDTIILKETYNNEFDHSFDTLLLNDQGLVIAENGKSTFEYDTEGYLVKSTTTSSNYTFTTTHKISGGNIIESTIVVDSVGHLKETSNYKYNFNSTPATSNTIGNENMGMPFYGKQDKNLSAGIHYTRVVDDITTEKDYSFLHFVDRYYRIVRKSQKNNLVNSYTDYTYSD